MTRDDLPNLKGFALFDVLLLIVIHYNYISADIWCYNPYFVN